MYKSIGGYEPNYKSYCDSITTSFMTKTNKERVPRIKELVSSNKLPSKTLQGLSGKSQATK